MYNRRSTAASGVTSHNLSIGCFLKDTVEILSICCKADGFAAISRWMLSESSQRLQKNIKRQTRDAKYSSL